MGLNEEMTLGEFFKLAARVASAAATIREASAMMGRPATVESSLEHVKAIGRDMAERMDAYAQPVIANSPGADVDAHRRGPGFPAIQWSAAEQATRDRLRAEREAAVAAAEAVVLEANP